MKIWEKQSVRAASYEDAYLRGDHLSSLQTNFGRGIFSLPNCVIMDRKKKLIRGKALGTCVFIRCHYNAEVQPVIKRNASQDYYGNIQSKNILTYAIKCGIIAEMNHSKGTS